MAQTDAKTLRQQASDHYLFALTPSKQIQEDGALIFSTSEGNTLTDIDGNQYLDMMSAFTRANSLGYGREDIARALYDQAITLNYSGTINWVAEPTVKLAAKLAELAPGRLSTAFFVSGGSEAVESAFKMAKQYHYYRNKPRANKIISRWNAYHGATMGAVAATDWLGTRNIAE